MINVKGVAAVLAFGCLFAASARAEVACPKSQKKKAVFVYDASGDREEIRVCKLLDPKNRAETFAGLVASAKRLKEHSRDEYPALNEYVRINAGVIQDFSSALDEQRIAPPMGEDLDVLVQGSRDNVEIDRLQMELDDARENLIDVAVDAAFH